MVIYHPWALLKYPVQRLVYQVQLLVPKVKLCAIIGVFVQKQPVFARAMVDMLVVMVQVEHLLVQVVRPVTHMIADLKVLHQQVVLVVHHVQIKVSVRVHRILRVHVLTVLLLVIVRFVHVHMVVHGGMNHQQQT